MCACVRCLPVPTGDRMVMDVHSTDGKDATKRNHTWPNLHFREVEPEPRTKGARRGRQERPFRVECVVVSIACLPFVEGEVLHCHRVESRADEAAVLRVLPKVA